MCSIARRKISRGQFLPVDDASSICVWSGQEAPMRRKPLSPDHATANTAVEHRLRAETNSPNDPSAVKLRHRQAIEHDREAASADTMYRRIREKTEPNQGDHPMSSTSTF